MKHRNFMKSVLAAAVLALCLSSAAFAASYTGNNIYPGLTGIQPEDTLDLPKNTVNASLTARWGVRVFFEDEEGNVLDSCLVPEGGGKDAAEAPPKSGYVFSSWKRYDSNSGTADADKSGVSNVCGPGPLTFRPLYKTVIPEDQNDGTITVINVTHDHDYAGYKILDAEISKSNPDSVIYTITEDSPWWEFVNEYFDLTEYRKDGDVTVYKADPKTGYDPKEAFENLPVDGKTPDLVKKTPDADDTVVWENVPFGYYAITSTLGSWVTVNTNKPDVDVIDKNQSSFIDKNIIEDGNKVKVNDAAFGQQVSFSIDLAAGNYDKNELVTYYHIRDAISDGFDYAFTEDSNVTVTVVGTQGDPVSTVTLTGVDSLSDLKNAASGYYFDYTEGSGEFEIIVKWAKLNEKGKLLPINHDEFNHIIVTYGAVVNNEAVVGTGGNRNTASYTYDITNGFDADNPPVMQPEPGHNEKDPESSVTTVTYVNALVLEKVDAADKSVHLQGVRFTCDRIRAVRISDGVYEVSADAGVAPAEYFEVPETGYILIKGLDSGEYSFEEILTLPGYNLLPSGEAVITVNAVTEEKPYVSAGTMYETDYSAELTVENTTGVELPSTGGRGTAQFLLVGAALILLSGVLLYDRQRR